MFIKMIANKNKNKQEMQEDKKVAYIYWVTVVIRCYFDLWLCIFYSNNHYQIYFQTFFFFLNYKYTITTLV